MSKGRLNKQQIQDLYSVPWARPKRRAIAEIADRLMEQEGPATIPTDTALLQKLARANCLRTPEIAGEINGYYSAPWVTQSLLPFMARSTFIVEPAAGHGGMSKVLLNAGKTVRSYDIIPYHDEDVHVSKKDFLAATAYDLRIMHRLRKMDGAIVTAPPEALIGKFIERACIMVQPDGLVAMWLNDRVDANPEYRHFFAESSMFARKIIPIFRKWPTNIPPIYKAWYLWGRRAGGSPMLSYIDVCF